MRAGPTTGASAPRFDPLQRWYHRLAATDEYEVWLLTWLPGQGTDLHDHGGSAGALAVVSGEVTEYTLALPVGLGPPGPVKKKGLGTGEARCSAVTTSTGSSTTATGRRSPSTYTGRR